jgi:single-strand DNA-binding protein
MNRVSLIGRLTRDPELRSIDSQDGRSVCDLRIAVDNGPNREATFIDVATFDRQAEACAQYLARGRQVAVDGRLVFREWDADDGSKRSRHSVIGRIEFLGSAGSNGLSQAETKAPPPAVGAADDSIDF